MGDAAGSAAQLPAAENGFGLVKEEHKGAGAALKSMALEKTKEALVTTHAEFMSVERESGNSTLQLDDAERSFPCTLAQHEIVWIALPDGHQHPMMIPR